jgi:hypothetical protein
VPESKELSEVVKIKISKSTKEKIQKVSNKEYHSFANQCQMILDEWADRHKNDEW